MRLKKAIRKIVALGTGATMVGATILGAMAAADLASYPAPFVADGGFNSLIVVGAAAMTEDVLGSIDVATSLQYANTVTTAVPGTGSSVSVVGEGIAIKTDSNNLVLDEALQTVKTNLDEDDLPTLLAKGNYVADGDDGSTEYEYSQKLEFGAGTNATVTWLRDRDYSDEDNPYLMLYAPKSRGSGSAQTWFMKYTLDFSKDAASDWTAAANCGSTNELCDFEDTKLEILGIEYDITKALRNGDVVTWEMMGGVSLNTMYEGETKTFTVNGIDYEVTIDIISDTGADESVILSVNGESTKELEKDQTDRVAGIEVGIKQVMGNEAGEVGAGRDLVQFYLGAQKVVLSDAVATNADKLGSLVKLGGQDVDDLYTDFIISTSASEVKIDKIELTWVPDDDLFAAKGETLTFPGLESFQIDYVGLTHDGNEELIVLEPHGDNNIQLIAPLQNGDVTLDILYHPAAGNYTGFGETTTAGSGVLHVAAGTVTEGDYIVLSKFTERETHIVEFDSVSNKNVTTLKNLADGTKYEATCLTDCSINVGDLTAVFTSVDPTANEVVLSSASDVSASIYTKEGLTIALGTINAVSATHDITITEENENGVLTGGDEYTVTAGLTAAGKTSITAFPKDSDMVNATGYSALGFQLGDTDKWGYYGNFGTYFEWDKSGDENSLEILYPGEEAHANVIVRAEGAVISESEGAGTYEAVQRIEVGAAVLDTEVASLTAQNVIVVGGPCVNALAAELMGNPAVCEEGFEMGKAMIRLFEHDNGNVALLVAGYSAMDTRRASRVVANYADYENFEGMELEVTGTSLSDIQVGVPVVVEEPAPADDADAGEGDGDGSNV